MNPALSKLFNALKAFSATMEMSVSNEGGSMVISSSYEMSSGLLRVETDLGSARGGMMPPQAVAQMKAMGMDRVVTISLPERKLVLIAYPGLKSYVEMPAPQAETESGATGEDVFVESGKEAIDGHPCVKGKMTVRMDQNAKRDLLIWKAADLNGFPVQIQIDDPKGGMKLLFRHIQTKEPPASRFAIPEGYTKYGNMQEMMQAAAAKMMQAGGVQMGGQDQ